MYPTIVLSVFLCAVSSVLPQAPAAEQQPSEGEIAQLLEKAESSTHSAMTRAASYRKLRQVMEQRGEYEAAYNYFLKERDIEATLSTESSLLTPILLVAIGIGILLLLLFQRLRKLEGEERRAPSDAASLTHQIPEPLQIPETPKPTSDPKHTKPEHKPRQYESPVEELTGNVAHDFNNLLQVIQTANEVILKSKGLARHEREMVKISAKSVAAGANMVNQLLAYSQQLNLQPCAISVEEFLEKYSNQLHATVTPPVRLEISNRAGDAAFTVDPKHLSVALGHLLGNAVESMGDEGKVQLECSLRTREEIGDTHLETHRHDSHFVAFSVTDQGHGMSAEQRDRACEPFYSTKSHGAGSGLGLSAVQGFAKQSQGDLRITSNANQPGTCVELIFPNILADLDLATAWNDSRRNECRVLLVEDKLEVGISLLARVRSLGFRAELAQAGEEAIHLIENAQNGFDIVVSDIQMPGAYDGIQLKDWMSKHRPALPVVLMTGHNSYSSLDLGTSILRKPFSESELLDAIRFERQRTQQKLQEYADDYAGQAANSEPAVTSGGSKN